MRTVGSNIITESEKARLTVVDLLTIVFPDPIGTKYWSTHKYTYNTHNYVPRVLSIGEWSRSVNAETDSLTITLGNVDGELTYINNLVEVELAEISLIRYFPDIAPSGEAIDPFWVGYGGSMELDEETAEWKISFGFRGFTQRGLRQFSQNCWKFFKDGNFCPYNGTSIGLAATLSAGIDDQATSFNVSDASLYDVYDIILINSEQMLVTSGLSNPLSVERGYNGTTQASHSSGATVYHHNCRKNKESCRRRRMFGPPDSGGDGKRYFGGWSDVPPISFKGYKWGRFKARKSPYTQSSTGNASIYGIPIPVVYGNFRMRGIEAVGDADAKEFKHALFIVSEGFVWCIGLSSILVNGKPPDDIPNPNSGSFDAKTQDSVIIWGGATGQRGSLGLMSNVNIDTYLSNPYLFAQADGDGPSLDNLCAVRVRIEEGGNEFDSDVSTLDITIQGRQCKTIGYLEGGAEAYDYIVDPIIVAVDYLTNGKFGARLDVSHVDLDQAEIEQDYCQAQVTPNTMLDPVITGTVIQGPADSGIFENRNDWAAVTLDVDVADGALAGHILQVTTVGKQQTLTIITNYKAVKVGPRVSNVESSFGFVDDTDLGQGGSTFYIIETGYRGLQSPALSSGDTFNVNMSSTGGANVDRFVFNGALTDDDSVEKQLALILQNCNGYYISRGRKIALRIRKQENLTTIDGYPVLTDTGADRNIVREDSGKSTFKIKRTAMIEGVPNQIDVTFFDQDNGFQETTIQVYDEDLQNLFGNIITGDKTRIVNSRQLKLIGTTTKDQAMRLGALALREAAMQRDVCTFQMSLKDALVLEPGDVRKLESTEIDNDPDRQLSARMQYIRIVKISETDKFTATIEAHAHNNGAYDDSSLNLISLARKVTEENPDNFPLDITPLDPVETIEYAGDGTTLSVVNVEVTYPS